MYTFRLVKIQDWDFWRALHREGYEARVAELWGEWDDTVQEQFARQEFDAAHDGQYIIVVDGHDAGYVSWAWKDEAFHLNNLMIHHAFRSKGLGGEVLRDLIAMVSRRGLAMRLRTFVNNPARRLYERLGFSITGDDGKHLSMVRE